MEPSARQQEIARHATSLFAQYGYRAVGMRAIAEAVGIRTSSLYHHFHSKEELLYAIAMAVTRDFLDGPASTPHDGRDGGVTACDELIRLVRRHVEYFARHREAQVVSRREMRELKPEHLAEAMAYERAYQARTEAVIRAGIDSGAFQAHDAKVTALALLDMLNGISAWYSDVGPLGRTALAERYAILALNLVGARSRPAGG